MGNTCKPMAVSFQCMTKFTTNKKKKERKKIKTNIQIGYRFCFNFLLYYLLCFPGSSAGKESTCHAGDPGSIPRLGRSAGEGIGSKISYILLYFIKFCWEH